MQFIRLTDTCQEQAAEGFIFKQQAWNKYLQYFPLTSYLCLAPSQMLLDALDDFLSNAHLNDTKIITALFETVENALTLIGQLLVQSSISKTSLHTRKPSDSIHINICQFDIFHYIFYNDMV